MKNVIFGGFGGQNGGQRPPIGPSQILRVEEVIRVPCAKFQLPSTFLARGAPCTRFMLKICQSAAPPFSRCGVCCVTMRSFYFRNVRNNWKSLRCFQRIWKAQTDSSSIDLHLQTELVKLIVNSRVIARSLSRSRYPCTPAPYEWRSGNLGALPHVHLKTNCVPMLLIRDNVVNVFVAGESIL